MADFLVGDFLAADFLAADFLVGDFLAAGFRLELVFLDIADDASLRRLEFQVKPRSRRDHLRDR